MELPRGTCGRLSSRSGLAASHGIEVSAGVFDRDFRGEVKVLIHHLSGREFWVRHGDRRFGEIRRRSLFFSEVDV